jgi:hypothetical protein
VNEMAEIEMNIEHDLRKLLSTEKSPIKHLELGKRMEDEYLDLLRAIDDAIVNCYKINPSMKDRDVIKALKNFRKDIFREYKPSVHPIEWQIQENLRFLFGMKNEFGIEKSTKQEVLMCTKYVLASVKRHHKVDGVRGYLDFIINYV